MFFYSAVIIISTWLFYISQKLYKKIYDYCSLNEFTNEETNKFIEDCLEKGFMIEL